MAKKKKEKFESVSETPPKNKKENKNKTELNTESLVGASEKVHWRTQHRNQEILHYKIRGSGHLKFKKWSADPREGRSIHTPLLHGNLP